ncbi:Uncharacterized protein APZ42_014743 [Daphnia magna]|uniref:Uncharacterized protein n=1 Tax=Daphnia magna TaxID=35525 RepID=A0A162PM58_9CRUS|nr:Uncharacterized protein APZ42_014743 [Daphnia magna]
MFLNDRYQCQVGSLFYANLVVKKIYAYQPISFVFNYQLEQLNKGTLNFQVVETDRQKMKYENGQKQHNKPSVTRQLE